jgi:hypothetical protein
MDESGWRWWLGEERIALEQSLPSRSVVPTALVIGVVGDVPGLVLVLALVGIFDVLAQGVAQQTREIGVRIGARRRPSGHPSPRARPRCAHGGPGRCRRPARRVFRHGLLPTLLYDMRPDDPSVLATLRTESVARACWCRNIGRGASDATNTGRCA